VSACANLINLLLGASPGVRILATSRQRLAVPDEKIMELSPLPVVHHGNGDDAVALFTERAAVAVPGFELTPDNQHAVISVCRRLDGIPLAIELAAMRLSELSVHEIEARLDERFELLNGKPTRAAAFPPWRGRRRAPRHQTLREALDWSHDLCLPAERMLWARLSVFPGDFTTKAAACICADSELPDDQIPTLIGRLTAKSILHTVTRHGVARHYLLDTVRAYGQERLTDRAQLQTLRRRHRDCYLELAEQFDADWFDARQTEWTQRMRAERTNLEAALAYCIATPGEAPAGTRLAGALRYYWFGCGAIHEGRHWLDRVLAADPDPSAHRLRALGGSTTLLLLQAEHSAALALAQQTLDHATQLHEPVFAARALADIGIAYILASDIAAARPLLEEALARLRDLDPGGIDISVTGVYLATAEVFGGRPAVAHALLADVCTWCRAKGDRWWLGYALAVSVLAARALGDAPAAKRYAQESLLVRRELRDQIAIAGSMERLAWLAAAEDDHRRAARLLGVADRDWRQAAGQVLYGAPYWLEGHYECEASARAALGDLEYEREFRAGTAVPLDDAITYALGT
jgi:non-specific serine/threonine protein kinase